MTDPTYNPPVDPPVDPAEPTTPAPEPTPAAPAPTAAPSSTAPAIGDVITYQLTDDDPETVGLVVGTVDAAEHRDAVSLVVPLPGAIAVPLDAVKG